MDGPVKYTGAGNDRDPILTNIGGVVPTNTGPNSFLDLTCTFPTQAINPNP